MPTHAEQVYSEHTSFAEPASGSGQTDGDQTVRVRRRRRRGKSKQGITPERVAKFVVLGVLALVATVLFTAEFLRSAAQAKHATAEHEQACIKAYKNGDVRLAAVACERSNWQRPR